MSSKIEQKIKDYINKSGKFTVLDKNENQYREYYTGVTVEYIIEYVFNNKYTRKGVINKLKKLHSEGEIMSLYCDDVKNIVFHNKKEQHNFGDEFYKNQQGRTIEELYEHLENLKRIK